MKNFSIFIYIAAIFLAPCSFAEEYDEKIIYSKGSWKVATWTYAKDSISCTAGNFEDEREFFIEINPYEKYEVLGFWYDSFIKTKNLKTISFKVDNNKGWYSRKPEMEDGSIYFYFDDATQESIDLVISEIMEGKKLVHLDDNDKVISTFDLTVSFASMDKLFECRKNL